MQGGGGGLTVTHSSRLIYRRQTGGHEGVYVCEYLRRATSCLAGMSTVRVRLSETSPTNHRTASTACMAPVGSLRHLHERLRSWAKHHWDREPCWAFALLSDVERNNRVLIPRKLAGLNPENHVGIVLDVAAFLR